MQDARSNSQGCIVPPPAAAPAEKTIDKAMAAASKRGRKRAGSPHAEDAENENAGAEERAAAEGSADAGEAAMEGEAGTHEQSEHEDEKDEDKAEDDREEQKDDEKDEEEDTAALLGAIGSPSHSGRAANGHHADSAAGGEEEDEEVPIRIGDAAPAEDDTAANDAMEAFLNEDAKNDGSSSGSGSEDEEVLNANNDDE